MKNAFEEEDMQNSKTCSLFTVSLLFLAVLVGVGTAEGSGASGVAAKNHGESIGLIATPHIAWGACNQYTYDWYGLGERMICGELDVPIDYNHPEEGKIKVSVIKIKAAHENRHRGAIVVNPGGPGALTGLQFAQDVFSFWNAGNPDHPGGALLKQITDDYDIVGFLPRGEGRAEKLVGNSEEVDFGEPGPYALTCQSEQLIPEFIDPDDRSAANIARMQDKARVKANGCQGDSYRRAAFVNTERTVRDLDLIRRALGEDGLNFYGTSYGTWMGVWYAVLFPGHIDRLVLDSSMDFRKPFDAAMLNQMASIQELVHERLIPNVLAKPDYYNLGTDPAYMARLMESLPPKVRQAVRNINITDLLRPIGDKGLAFTAGQGVAKLLRDNPQADANAMLSLSSQYTYSNDQGANGAARFIARGMIMEYFSADASKPLNLDISSSVNNAVTCNDGPLSNPHPEYWAMLGNEISSPSLMADTGDVTGNPCIYWLTDWLANKPPEESVGTLPPTLMLQLQYDPLTPLSAARAMHTSIPSSSLVVMEDMEGHGVIAKGNECASRLVGEYFINRSLPPFDTVCSANDEKGSSMFVNPEQTKAIREKLQHTIISSNIGLFQ